ncbi:6-carboxyhexanoate--CoA ligase [Phorcysia thermohydrogeniphila]|uniref:6-carboxyhexanoate--CoA ligase n=1 Tax=Phorcysia thermohydrogeniphila TaxID=936138 RepID=A0A4R1GGW5_9BACT|nr:6-carboxyhexanoate--CoA ligase [Phorcysia thermohydrogeniphila]TCK06203.1 6-carboxyhexanoate--CoA ligase [Phorcysia thermohydrogeniphila]
MEKLYSVKMRSSAAGHHISGAERIVREEEIEKVAGELVRRALNHSKGKPDFINLKVELLSEEPLRLTLLPVIEVTGNYSAERVLKELFSLSPIPVELGLRVYRELLSGPAPDGKTMRGAMIVEVPSGKRLEPDKFRGVRASYLDITKEAERKLRELTGERFTENFKEALTLSTKILNYPAVLGELCVSDDPDYTTGYLSLKGVGYIRIKNIKEAGSPLGGRAIFVRESTSLDELIRYLEKIPVLADRVSSYSLVPAEELSKVFSENSL